MQDLDSLRQLAVHEAWQTTGYNAAITPDEAADEYKLPLQLIAADRKKLKPYLFGYGAKG